MSLDMDRELERFKTEIDLIAFAASRGYVRDGRESSQNCEVMRTSNGDKVVIVKHIDNKGAEHWVYYCVRDARDNGTIIDFLQWRGGGSLGQIRKVLREWLGSPRPAPAGVTIRKLLPVSNDRAAVILAWERARSCLSLPYLTARGIGPDVLAMPQFSGCIRTDDRGNALFPHYDWEGLCGFEIKNHGFTGFSAGGSKGLWFSKAEATAPRLVLAESAIDAISFHVLNPSSGVRYLSIGGNMNHGQPELIRSAMEKMAPGSVVILAFDYDEAGEELAEEVTALAPSSVEVQRILPPVGTGKDWNEVLKLERGIIEPSCPATVGPDFGKTPPLKALPGEASRKSKAGPRGPKRGQ